MKLPKFTLPRFSLPSCRPGALCGRFSVRGFVSFCRMIRIEHSIFALPYAWAGSVMAAGGMPPWDKLVLLTIAMVGVRSFAMGINRIFDLPFDRENPRTANRHLVTGEISVRQAWIFSLVMAAIFVLACAAINTVCLILSVPALIFAAVYSLTKRFSAVCHFWLGATLGLAPLAGALAVNPEGLAMGPIMLFFAVTFWVGAFDIYYSFQDYDFDVAFRLCSVPSVYGPDTALAIAGFSHAVTSIFLFLTGIAAGLAWPWYVLWAGVSAILFWEHHLMRPQDLSRVNMVFFTLNGIISPLVLVGVILGMVL